MAFELFEKLCNCNVLPDDYTLATVAKFSGKVHLVARKSVHGKSIRVGKVFEEMAQRKCGVLECDNSMICKFGG
ncbi:pentatricopeptide repeat-containing protein [Prunus yedoensis var. nudiflora]|uniref:Pentatricopeptide repeat-containing protein n=1 Tax=Prunus yedoensis var. nudiflora TaxID=2094558 RepID=A0A314YP17_PRUYE|nr:pentatricopeptide repeat-containing protein [Prunus yedoensis var. nudiflora]